ncbi:MAG TPA: polysaccharide pyruvyl transferase family protein [Pseudobacteroides sp.]|uniref:polysaccharide pyruvyl transferase family protein n=1 Tax=Pseudobacteroides sp. TaxID=1968840 RepID=UPI002F91D767
MKKVGILSMQRIANYGSFLQAYALKQLLEQQSCQVEFVDYHVERPIISEYSDRKNPIVRKLQKGLETFKYHAPLSHKLAFITYKQSFAKKYLPLLGITEKMNYTPELDCLVIGSDEVFNCIQKNSNVGYSLELFGKDNRAKKLISYAASFGNTTLEKLQEYDKIEEIGELLKKFDAVSVRDKNSGSLVTTLTSKEPEYHLDPVLAYDYTGCCKIIPDMRSTEKYLILYAYSGRISDKEADWITAYAKRKNLKVYAIGGIQKCADRFIDCSPFEVLAYFQHAEEVITDTFHGSIFSIITHRNFVTIVRKSLGNSYGNEEKLTDLLERLGLRERIAMGITETETVLSRDIDFAAVDQIITLERERTRSYIGNQITQIL